MKKRRNRKFKKIIIINCFVFLFIFSLPVISHFFNNFVLMSVNYSLGGKILKEDKNDISITINSDSDKDLNRQIERDNFTMEMFSLLKNFEKTKDEKIAEDNPINQTRPDDAMPLVEKFYQYKAGGNLVQNHGNGLIKNATTLEPATISGIITQDPNFKINLNSNDPQVLIMHTHGTETYEKFDLGYYDPNIPVRTKAEDMNMLAVGAAIQNELEKSGIKTLQDKTLHDDPQYNGSYQRSRLTVQQYLQQYPSIKIVLDVHRDAIQTSNGDRYKPTAIINDKKAAQIMLITGTTGKGVNLPNYAENLKFSSKLQNYMESMYKGLTRPILFDYRHYNQDLTTGSVLVEVGGHGNTISEAIYSGQLVGTALAEMLKTML
ncbi:MAG: stage II sporulation protein P [Oscillospiraceae bacterium]